VDTNNPAYSTVAGVLFNKSQTKLIQYPSGKAGTYTIPASVTSICDYAFESCASLGSVMIPVSVTNIEDHAFAYCTSLTGVYCQGNAPSLGSSVFDNDDNATVYYLPGTKGWSSPFGGLPAALWQQVILTVTANPTQGGTVTGSGTYWADANVQLAATAANGWWFLGWSDGATNNPYSITVPPTNCTYTAYFTDTPPQFSYTIASGAVTITGYTGSGGPLTIPDTITGLRVTSIGDLAFYNCTSLTSVTIGTNVTNIGRAAFSGCTNLTSVTIPNSVTRIGDSAFDECSSLTEITVGTSNPAYTSVAGVLFDKSQSTLIQYPGGKAGNYTIPTSVTNIGDYSFDNCHSLTSVTMGNSVTSIGDYSFYTCSSLTSVTIPNSVTSIGDGAFMGCTSLTNVTIGNSVTSIGDWAFAACHTLTSVTIGNSVSSIGGDAFALCSSLTGVYFQGNAPSLGSSVFYRDDNATVYYLPGTRGWSSPFGGLPAALWQQVILTVTVNPTQGGTVTGSGTYWPGTNVQLPATAANGWRFLGWSDGATNNPYSIRVPPTNCTYTAYFTDTPPQFSYTVASGAVTITGYTGSGGRLTIPDTITGLRVTSIGDLAFYNCTSLTSVTIGTNVTNIGWAAFDRCSSLTEITVGTSNPAYSSVAGVLFDKSQSTLIQYPGGKAGNYTIPTSVTSIGVWAFADCYSLTSVTIGNDVTSIGDGAFADCYTLTSVTIGNSVTSIGGNAFTLCYSLTNVTIPSSVTSIGNSAFVYCYSLTGVYFQGNVPGTGTDSTVFSGDSNLTVYYLLNRIGWGTTFDGRPAVLWNPRPQNPGVQRNEFGFTITGTPNIPIVVQACANLTSPVWISLQSCTLTNGSLYFSDPGRTNYPARFYRLRSP
jgi:hypothetical protein